MSVRSSSALNHIHQVRWVQRFSMIFVGSALAAGTLYSYKIQTQKEKAKPIVKQALSICRAFATNCQADGEPRFVQEQVPLPATHAMKRPMWYVPLRADGASYAMMLRADTGRLCYVFDLSPWDNVDSAHNAKSHRIEPERAIDQSLLYLQRLNMVAPKTQIALVGNPESTREEAGWRIIWKTRSSANAVEEKIRVVVSQKNGKLLQVADTEALNQAVR